MANKPKIIKRKECMVKKKGKREKKQQHFLKRKRGQLMSVSNGTKAGYSDNSDNNTAGQQMLMNYPTQRRNERSH